MFSEDGRDRGATNADALDDVMATSANPLLGAVDQDKYRRIQQVCSSDLGSEFESMV